MGTRATESKSWFARPKDFESNVKVHLPVLYRVAKRMGCTNEEAEDVVQTTVIKAFKAWESFDGEHLRSWLIRILRNERLMNLRSRESKNTSLDDSDTFEIADKPFWEPLSHKIQAEHLLRELDALPEIYKLTIHLCDVEELTYEDASQVLDVPVGTIRSRLFRARGMLRDRLIAYIDPQDGGSK